MNDTPIQANTSLYHPDKEANVALWEALMTRGIAEPSVAMRAWNPHPEKLALVLIEGRAHPWLQGVLWNAAHVYGGRDVGLLIVHTRANATRMREITAGWSGVWLHELEAENITVQEYNRLLTSKGFWELFCAPAPAPSHVLLFQTDTLMRRAIDGEMEKWARYAYVGAPWPAHWRVCSDSPTTVGNGGLSLRSVARMYQISRRVSQPVGSNEDVFYCNRLFLDELPSGEEAKSFSVEHVYDRDPAGLHQAYFFHSAEVVRGWLRGLPCLKEDFRV